MGGGEGGGGEGNGTIFRGLGPCGGGQNCGAPQLLVAPLAHVHARSVNGRGVQSMFTSDKVLSANDGDTKVPGPLSTHTPELSAGLGLP